MASDSDLGSTWFEILRKVISEELVPAYRNVLEKEAHPKVLEKIRKSSDAFQCLNPNEKEIFESAVSNGYTDFDISSLCTMALDIYPKIFCSTKLESIGDDMKNLSAIIALLSSLTSVSKEEFDQHMEDIRGFCQTLEKHTGKRYFNIVCKIKESVLDRLKEKDISLKKDDMLRNFETWFHQEHRSINIRHLYLGKVCTSRGKLEKGEIVIVSVIESRKTIENEKYRYDGEKFTVVYKCWGETSLSEEEKTHRGHSIGTIKEIANFLKEKENELFEKHSNLEMVRTSQFRMKRKLPKNEENEVEICEPCIALYCSYKGIVPLGEEEFPAEMGGFPTDIREGFFYLHVNFDIYANSKDLLDPLRMGASISRNTDGAGEGTLGGFVELNDGGVGFLTCAHVFHTAGEMQAPPTNLPSPVVQPSVSKEGSQHCGTTLRSAFPSSTIVDGVSVDATVVKLSERVPDRALFADLMTARLKTLGFSRGRLPQVSCGGIRSMKEAQDRLSQRTLKCGMMSGLTLGELHGGEAHVKLRSISPTGERFSTMYKSQLEIQKIMTTPFSTNGDSGALVFQFKDPSDLKCIGMIVGGDGNVSIATPIASVLEALSVTLKDF